jgi:dynein heavy chain
MLEAILSVQPKTGTGSGKSREQTITEIAEFVESKTPPIYPIFDIQKKYPTSYEESMNTVIVQEVIRYNRLLVVMKENLTNVKKALKGLIVMSEELELVSNSLFDNQVPKLWDEKGFLSMKPLASWTEDLNARIAFLDNWIDNGTPKCFWISGFFFPQAFLTGTLQNYARKHVIAIDKLSFEFNYLTIQPDDVKEKPEDGCYIHGLFLEGARWEPAHNQIQDPKPK